MASIVTTYNKSGTRLAFLNVPTVRSWSLNDEQNAGYGTCTFDIATTDPKCTRANLEFGNLLYVEDENDELPDWVGIIDSVQGREFHEGFVRVGATAAETIANWRLATLLRPIISTPGVALKEAIAFANSNPPKGRKIYPGRIHNKTGSVYVAPGMNLLDAIKKISKSCGSDWNITARMNSENALELIVNLYDGQKGDNTNVVLNEQNTKVLSPTLIENGEIWNYCIYYGQAGGGGVRYAVAQNHASIGQYDLRATIKKAGGTDEDVLQALANEFVAKSGQPERTLALSVTNKNNIFRYMDVGNIMTFDSSTFGFFDATQIGAHETVKINGMEYDDMVENELGMTVEIL